MATRIKVRNDSSKNWNTANPILKLGEMGLETDTIKIKYGDGVTAWSSLNYGTTDIFQRLYRTPVYNPIISTQCQYYADLENFIIDIRLTGDILGTSENPKYWAPLSVLTDIKTVMLYETDAEGNYLTTYNSISVSLKGDGLSYALNQEVKDKNGLTGKLSIVVDWALWKHGKQEAMNPLRLNNDILKDHFGFISILENEDVTTDNVKPSYIKNVDSANILNWNNGIITQYHGKSGFTFTNSNAGNDGGIRTGNFTPDPNYHCIVDINLKSITPSGNVTLYLYGTNGDVLLTSLNVPIGTTKLEFDPAYYTVYNNQNTFYLVLSVNGTAETITVDVKDFICAQYPIGQTDNLTEIIKNLQSKISVLEGKVTTLQSTSDVTLISPNGSKYVLSITDDGNVTSIPIIPNKALFIGNSLLLGNGTFGMNATNNTKDYYDLIKEEILAVGSGNYTSNKTSGTAFEDCESTTAGNAWLEDILKPQLSQDLDLVLIQLGDNVNTESKRTAFKTNAVNMLTVIKSIAKKARIAWVYGWYANSDVKAAIQSACKTYGGIYIEINDLNTLENQSKIGEVITHTEVGNYNIHYDTVSDDSTGIDVTFTVDGKQYSSHIVAETYSFDNTTKILTWTGYQSITTNSGVASHPGDLGFEKIADRILEGLKMKNYDTANYR